VRWLADYPATRGAIGDRHWSICVDLICCMNVMSFGGLLERRKSKSEDLPRDKRQKWNCEKQQKETEKEKEKRSEEVKKKKRNGNEKGKAATEKREELTRVG
jgi:hypothetical protein